MQGPNYVWHLDGNDKLGIKYGFYIHGCIDGSVIFDDTSVVYYEYTIAIRQNNDNNHY